MTTEKARAEARRLRRYHDADRARVLQARTLVEYVERRLACTKLGGGRPPEMADCSPAGRRQLWDFLIEDSDVLERIPDAAP